MPHISTPKHKHSIITFLINSIIVRTFSSFKSFSFCQLDPAFALAAISMMTPGVFLSASPATVLVLLQPVIAVPITDLKWVISHACCFVVGIAETVSGGYFGGLGCLLIWKQHHYQVSESLCYSYSIQLEILTRGWLSKRFHWYCKTIHFIFLRAPNIFQNLNRELMHMDSNM